jgi:hypothetical protein
MRVSGLCCTHLLYIGLFKDVYENLGLANIRGDLIRSTALLV